MIRVPQEVFDRLVVRCTGFDLDRLQEHHCTLDGVWIVPPADVALFRDDLIDVTDPQENVFIARFCPHYITYQTLTNEDRWLLPIVVDNSVLSRRDEFAHRGERCL